MEAAESRTAGKILELENLRKVFGGVVAVDGVSAGIESGSVTSLIGPNGAGKTTVFNMITGFLTPTAGTMVYAGRPIKRLKPHHVAFLGVARTFQNVRLFFRMSVLENVMVGRHLRSRTGMIASACLPPVLRREEKRIRREAGEWLDFVGLGEQGKAAAGSLPLGSQRMLEIARALALEPDLLLLDEPAAGLNSRETLAMGEMIEKIRRRGITVVLVEHDMELVMDISDRVLVINFGRIIGDGTPEEVQDNPDVISAYLGE
ncbi:MAG: ABC transporter ATP-binding protein [Desulfosalsimonadaceae bacterium]